MKRSIRGPDYTMTKIDINDYKKNKFIIIVQIYRTSL